MKEKYDIVIVGAGVAGLNCALHLPEDKSILIICKGRPEESDSYLAQGGICCLQGEEDYESYFNDTMRAGHNENNPATVECMIKSSPEVISDLLAVGVDFAREEDGSLSVTREGGHSRNRICFHKDCTGKEITSKLMAAVSALKNVDICPKNTLIDLICNEKACMGIVVFDNSTGKVKKILSDYTVLATGGIGGIFYKSTNFRLLTGDGVAICLSRGVAVDNVNYIQIHPTTLFSSKKGKRSFLISESVRGEGAHLLDMWGERFCDELQPRDVVTEAIYEKMEEESTNYVRLDMSPVGREELSSHFPSIVKKCEEEGYDPFTEPVPVVPAQHYFMGGIRSDLNGRTTMSRLYAVGETCCNGVHGANRLASNSLLESILFAKRAALDIADNFTPIAGLTPEYVANNANLGDYSNPVKLLKGYKRALLKAIEEANEEC